MARKINQHKTTYYKEYGALVTFIFISFLLLTPTEQQTYTRENQISQPTKMVEVKKENSKQEIESKIKHYFPLSWRDMIPVAYAESRLNPNAIGYNCYYNEDETIVYTSRVKGSHSTSCKKSHRKYAWSRDCGIMQMNTKDKECPVETIDEHLQRAADLSRIQGKTAWVAYKTGAHLTYK